MVNCNLHCIYNYIYICSPWKPNPENMLCSSTCYSVRADLTWNDLIDVNDNDMMAKLRFCAGGTVFGTEAYEFLY